MRGVFAVLVLLAVATGGMCHRHHPVDSDEFTRRHVLRSACSILDGDGEEVTSRPCPGGVECTMGPLEGIYMAGEDRHLTAFYCNITFTQHMRRRGPCRAENADGVVIRQRECLRGGECNIGPRSFTYAGNEVNAFFCGRGGARRMRGDRRRQHHPEHTAIGSP